MLVTQTSSFICTKLCQKQNASELITTERQKKHRKTLLHSLKFLLKINLSQGLVKKLTKPDLKMIETVMFCAFSYKLTIGVLVTF